MRIKTITHLVIYIENNIEDMEGTGELIDGDICLYHNNKTIEIPLSLWEIYKNEKGELPFMSLHYEFDIIGYNWFCGGEEDRTALTWNC